MFNIAAGLKGIDQGNKEVEARRDKQIRLEREKQLWEQQNQTFETNSQIDSLKLQQLLQQQKQIAIKTIRDDGRNALINFGKSGSVVDLNRLVSDPNARKAFGGYTNFKMNGKTLYGTMIQKDGTTRDVPIPREQLTKWMITSGAQESIDEQERNIRLQEADIAYKQSQVQKNIATVNKPPKPPTITNASMEKRHIDLAIKKENGMLTPDEEIEFKELDRNSKTDLEIKSEYIAKGTDIKSKYRGHLFDTDISDEDIVNAQMYGQIANIKPDTKENREFKDQFIVLKQGKKLNRMVQNLGEEEIARGIYDSGLQTIKTWIDDGKKPDEKMLKTISVETKLGKFIASYIKSISGLAVSDAEYRRLRDLMGGDNWKNTHTLKQAFDGFVGELDSEFKNKAEVSLLDNPHTTLDLVQRYKRLNGQVQQPQQSQVQQPKEMVVNPRTGQPSNHYVGEVVQHQGKNYRIIDIQGNMEEVK